MIDCLFCKIIAGDIPSQKVFESEDFFAFKDIQPQAPVHILVVPKAHVAKLSDISDSQTDVSNKLLTAISKLANDLHISKNGYRVVINNGETAGQSVFHLHAHILSGRNFTWPPG